LYIEDRTFSNCSSLTSIVIPEGVKSIGREAFYHCTSLTSVTIPSSVTRIGDRAFDNCTGLQKLNFTGTKKQWENITKNTNWKVGSSIKTIVCSDKKVKAK
jgi:hypothetical protein